MLTLSQQKINKFNRKTVLDNKNILDKKCMSDKILGKDDELRRGEIIGVKVYHRQTDRQTDKFFDTICNRWDVLHERDH